MPVWGLISSNLVVIITGPWTTILEEKRAHSSHVTLFFNEDFEVLIDDCDSQKNT